LDLLFVDDNQRQKAIKMASTRGNVQTKRDWLQIKVKETEIPEVLSDFLKADLKYQEINIKKPTLEDYFIQLAQGEQHED
jgi:hypothetical protein